MITLTDENFEKEITNAPKPILVDFWAQWCSPCLILGPILEKLSEEYQDKFILAKVNVQENPIVASRFGISAIPTVMLFKNGKVADEFTGVIPEREIKEFLGKVEPTEVDLHIKRGDEYYKLGKLEEAVKEYQNALEKEPRDDSLQYKIGSIYFEREIFIEAKKYLKAIEYIEEAKKLLDIIHFKDIPVQDIDKLKEKLIRNPNDVEIFFELANQYARIGDYQKSLDGYLSVLMKDKKYKDGIARKSMLKIFNILGDDHFLTKEYRRKLTDVIF